MKIGRFALWLATQAVQAGALLCAAIFGQLPTGDTSAGWWMVAALILGGLYGCAENLRGYYEGLHCTRCQS